MASWEGSFLWPRVCTCYMNIKDWLARLVEPQTVMATSCLVSLPFKCMRIVAANNFATFIDILFACMDHILTFCKACVI